MGGREEWEEEDEDECIGRPWILIKQRRILLSFNFPQFHEELCFIAPSHHCKLGFTNSYPCHALIFTTVKQKQEWKQAIGQYLQSNQHGDLHSAAYNVLKVLFSGNFMCNNCMDCCWWLFWVKPSLDMVGSRVSFILHMRTKCLLPTFYGYDQPAA